ncbi:tyrosine-protein phosphatase [Fodinicola acaciae]|uniref:tyrosine-protein phosphatase n=1 Tax=Fodinicola acaciae TaxID=2681555 RepID=UPI0013D349BC|nr:tyrosine-protein phosphatase [Fodinicola acaciae]
MTTVDVAAARAGGMCNLRDIGQMSASIRPGVVYRGDAPQDNDPPPRLTPWPPRTVVDLRSVDERQPVHPLTDAKIHHVQLLAAANPLLVARHVEEEGPQTLANLYVSMALHRAEQLVRIAEIVANEPKPVLIHCSAGKDRTGVAVALLLSAVGVPRAEIVDDFLLTNDNIDQITARIALYLGADPNETAFEANRPAHAVGADAIGAVLDVFEGHPGGTPKWLTDNGFSDLDALRSALLRQPSA